MSHWNYQTLLEYLGLSQGQFILVAIIVFLLSSFVYLLYRLGLLGRVKFTYSELERCKLVYISYQGNYDMIQTIFSQTMDDANTIFKFSDPFGIYYDNPKQIQNPDESRAILGCLVNPLQVDKINVFLQKFPQYKTAQIPKTKILQTKYPFMNTLSVILIIMRVYPVLAEQVKNKKVNTCGIMEIYKLNDKYQHVNIFVPTENLSEFNLWYEPSSYTKVMSSEQKKNQ